MQTRDKGIRSILRPPLSPAEIKEDQEAMRAVINKVGPINPYQPIVDTPLYNINASLDKLQAASTKPIKEVRDKDGFTPKQNREIHKYLTRPPDPHARERREKRELLAKQNKQKIVKSPIGNVRYVEAKKPKPMPIVKYINRMNQLYGADTSEPTKQGVKDLQRVTDAVHKQDGTPNHQPEWRWSINRKELVDIKDPNFKGL